ncbi:putative lipid scramblase CLPTM1 [Lycorma delicatula]|uniref:putative lipid scramblase CLPTM1 n=1 Tax=Lycorma delicatula TaxID=130591 RepID=UPI003F50F162
MADVEFESTSDRTEENNSDGAVAERDVNAEVDAARQQYQPTKLESFFAITKSLIIRALVIYFISSFFRRPATQPDQQGGTIPSRVPAFNIFENGTLMDMYVYLSEDENFSKNNRSTLIWQKDGLIYGDWTGGPNNDGTYDFETKIEASKNVRNNGSLYLHVFIIKREGNSKKPEKLKLSGKYVTKATKQLNRFKKLRFTKTQNLLTGETAATPEEVMKAETLQTEIVSHWHPNLTINLVTDQTNWVQGSIPPPLNEYFEFTSNGEQYKPPVYFNEFWNMIRDYQPINETTKTLDLRLTYQPLSLFRWQIYSAQTMRSKWTSGLFQEDTEDEDQDSIKEALLDTSPYLLAATVIVSILHSVFELLAFKNDIQFWNNRKSLEGLSVRMVFFNVFQSVVILLFVLDNDANMLIRISCFFSLAIELWKINKVVDINLDRENKILGFLPRVKFTDKGSYVESSTKQYDQLAFKYLSWALYPLLIGYAVYSLLYQEHKGWYSWVLNMLYGFLLTFGFIMMTPQLFINYKLKSVAHLPWRMLSYKCLNTFIDDIFAFVIKMPTMYRIGCFRDDIVFFIFLYQRWIYKTDLTRVNEFGYSGEMEEEANKQVAVINGAPKGMADKKDD